MPFGKLPRTQTILTYLTKVIEYTEKNTGLHVRKVQSRCIQSLSSLNNKSIQMFYVNMVWMWNIYAHRFVHCGLFLLTYNTVLLSLVPSIQSKYFCAWFICTSIQIPSLLMFIFASPSCDGVGVTLYDGGLRREVTVHKIERQYPIMVNKRKKKEATFSKCHFGNFQLTSGHNSLSSTFSCKDALFSAPIKNNSVVSFVA